MTQKRGALARRLRQSTAGAGQISGKADTQMSIIEKLGALFGSKDEGLPRVRPGRNEPCWCGSGNKYKKCHGPEDEKKAAKACSINCGPT